MSVREWTSTACSDHPVGRVYDSTKPAPGYATGERYLEGRTQFEQGNLPAALAIFEEVLVQFEEEQDWASVASATLAIGDVYQARGNYTDAKKWYRDALGKYIELENDYDEHNEAVARYNLASVAVLTNRLAEAEAEYALAIRIWQRIGHPFEEAVGLTGLGLALRGLGRYDEALMVMEHAETIQQQLTPNPGFEGYLLINKGFVRFSMGDFENALALFRTAQKKLANFPFRVEEMQVLSNLASAQVSLGRFDEARANYQEALTFIQRNGLPLVTAQMELNLAAIHLHQGDYQIAIDLYDKTLAVFQEHGAQFLDASTRQNIGVSYLRLGELVAAQSYLEEAKSLFSALGSVAEVAAIQNSLGALAYLAGHLDDAEAVYLDALAMWETLENPVGISQVYGNLMLIAADKNELEQALAYGEKALALMTELATARIGIACSFHSVASISPCTTTSKRPTMLSKRWNWPPSLMIPLLKLAAMYCWP